MNTNLSLTWPSSDYNDFETILNDALNKNKTLTISGGVSIYLDKVLHLKKNGAELCIISAAKGNSRPVIYGTDFSIFLMGGKNIRIKIENIIFKHNCISVGGGNKVGAVFYCRHQSLLEVKGCCISSHNGFGVWAVQSAKVQINESTIHSFSRSGCVMFGNAEVYMVDCVIQQCAVHGICLRGLCQLKLCRCKILCNQKRGVYGYHNVHIVMEDCLVSGSDIAAVEIKGRHPHCSAVASEIASLDEVNSERDILSVSVSRCDFSGNMVGLKVSGNVEVSVLQCLPFERTIEEAALRRVTDEMNGSEIYEREDGDETHTVVVWEYEVDGGVNERWVAYSALDSEQIEQTAKRLRMNNNENTNIESHIVRIHVQQLDDTERDYDVDLKNLLQTNVETHCVRAIRRRFSKFEN